MGRQREEGCPEPFGEDPKREEGKTEGSRGHKTREDGSSTERMERRARKGNEHKGSRLGRLEKHVQERCRIPYRVVWGIQNDGEWEGTGGEASLSRSWEEVGLGTTSVSEYEWGACPGLGRCEQVGKMSLLSWVHKLCLFISLRTKLQVCISCAHRMGVV